MITNQQQNILHKFQNLYDEAISSNSSKEIYLRLRDFIYEYHVKPILAPVVDKIHKNHQYASQHFWDIPEQELKKLTINIDIAPIISPLRIGYGMFNLDRAKLFGANKIGITWNRLDFFYQILTCHEKAQLKNPARRNDIAEILQELLNAIWANKISNRFKTEDLKRDALQLLHYTQEFFLEQEISKISDQLTFTYKYIVDASGRKGMVTDGKETYHPVGNSATLIRLIIRNQGKLLEDNARKYMDKNGTATPKNQVINARRTVNRGMLKTFLVEEYISSNNGLLTLNNPTQLIE